MTLLKKPLPPSYCVRLRLYVGTQPDRVSLHATVSEEHIHSIGRQAALTFLNLRRAMRKPFRVYRDLSSEASLNGFVTATSTDRRFYVHCEQGDGIGKY